MPKLRIVGFCRQSECFLATRRTPTRAMHTRQNYVPVPAKTTAMVRKMILKSNQMLQLSI